jgi:FkbM family methyltransferase
MTHRLVFDIGANIGNWAIANLEKADQIISVEASPKTFQKLTEVCRPYSKITCLNYAVCDSKEEEIVFYEAAFDTISTLNKDWLASDSSRFVNTPYNEIRCKPISLDKLIETYGLPDLIKIDVEGAEDVVIKSLSTKCKMICFEWASEMNKVIYNCLDHLIKLGFNKFCIQTGDDYNYHPARNQFVEIIDVCRYLSTTVPKVDWGMIWCI